MSRLAELRAALTRAPLRTLPRRALLRLRYGPSRIDPTYLEAVALAELRARPAAPLVPREASGTRPLEVAVVIPPFFRGSGGHTTIANIVRALEARGHRLSFWIDDPGRRIADLDAAARDFAAWFGPFRAPVHPRFDAWRPPDVAVATGYQTVLRVRALPAGARAYLVQDHEPEFFATSAERLHAEDSYRHGFHAITAGSWLAGLMRERYGLTATPFELGVAHDVYRPHPEVRREPGTVVFYARATTPRRAVPIGLAALRELRRRRPQTRILLYGQPDAPRLDVPAEHLGVLSGPELARAYARAEVGLSISLTNYSLVPQEMLACGLACVEAATPSVLAAFGADGPVLVAEPEPHALAAALERLLDDPSERERRVAAGQALVRERTWAAAAEAIEAGLREALARRAG
jgi:glycosyltransferase involved in cell wall biosynthesis